MSILQEHLKTYGGPHGSHHVYWIPVGVFNSLPIESWKYNRRPDAGRVQQINEFMKDSKRADGMIYLACIDNKLVCYESNHRREALKTDMPPDMSQILVDVLWNATDEQVKQEFFRLNKAISVPELYVDSSAEESVATVLAAVDAFCAKYPKARSASGRPNRPSYNRDTFTQEFVRVMKELHISPDELLLRLDRLNLEMRTRPIGRMTVKCAAKCNAAGLWLFAWSPSLNAKELE